MSACGEVLDVIEVSEHEGGRVRFGFGFGFRMRMRMRLRMSQSDETASLVSRRPTTTTTTTTMAWGMGQGRASKSATQVAPAARMVRSTQIEPSGLVSKETVKWGSGGEVGR
jgi:hypothetical protein